jgi:hypothetical protein
MNVDRYTASGAAHASGTEPTSFAIRLVIASSAIDGAALSSSQ